jgi:hypothetical protein
LEKIPAAIPICNSVIAEASARGLGLDARPQAYTDLDELIGSWQKDPAFDRAIADFQRIETGIRLTD